MSGRGGAREPRSRPVRERLRALTRLAGQRASSSLVAPHRRAQPGGPRRAAARLPLPQPVPRGPDRRPGPEPADPGRDHRRRRRRLRRRSTPTRSPSIPTSCCSCRPARASASATTAVARVLDQSRARRAAAAPPGDADAHPRPHLRPRRLPADRLPLALFARRHPALRPAAARAEEQPTIVERTWNR